MNGNVWKSFFKPALFVALIIWGVGVASAESLPVIGSATVIGRADNSSVICRGEACAGVIWGLQQQSREFATEYEAMIDFDPPIDYSTFCLRLSQAEPYSGCRHNVPVVAGISPAWGPNGCGPGGAIQLALNAVGAILTETGDLNEPARGASFATPCNNHDRCWGMGYNRIACDEAFRSEMQGSCNANLSGADNFYSCHGYAAVYHAAVAGSIGTSIRSDVERNRSCAVWAKDMKDNACSS